MRYRCANIMTMMCLTLVLIGFACDVTTAAGAVVGEGTPESCTQEALQKAVDGGGTVTFDCGPTATISVTSPIYIGAAVTIDGGGNRITLDAGGYSRLFVVNYVWNIKVTLRGLTLVNGFSEDDGGAIKSDLAGSNHELIIENSTLAYNHAERNGGAIWAGNTTLTNSTVTENLAGVAGGAIYVRDYSLLRLNRSTISANEAGTAGGVFFEGYNGSSLIWYDSILAGNSASSYGDCYDNGFYSTPVSLYGVLGPNRCGIENGYGQSTGNILGVDPLLGMLADNGGPTPTMLPLLGSPAIHNGNSQGYSWSTEDQRGYSRSFPYDIGAVETRLLLNPIGNKTVQVGNLLTITVTASAPEGDTLTYSATGLPAGATWNSATHTFQWQPTGKQTGSYQVTFTVTDNEMPPESASETITITVTGPNRPPVFDPLSKYNVIVGQILAFKVNATDPDGNSVNYSSSNLPTGATLNATTGQFQWRPSTTGVYKVTFTATDNGVPAKSSSITTSINVTKK